MLVGAGGNFNQNYSQEHSLREIAAGRCAVHIGDGCKEQAGIKYSVRCAMSGFLSCSLVKLGVLLEGHLERES